MDWIFKILDFVLKPYFQSWTINNCDGNLLNWNKINCTGFRGKFTLNKSCWCFDKCSFFSIWFLISCSKTGHSDLFCNKCEWRTKDWTSLIHKLDRNKKKKNYDICKKILNGPFQNDVQGAYIPKFSFISALVYEKCKEMSTFYGFTDQFLNIWFNMKGWSRLLNKNNNTEMTRLQLLTCLLPMSYP